MDSSSVADWPAEPAPAEPLSGHLIVCGLGHVGYRIVELLIRLGQRGVVIAQQVNADWQAHIEPHFRVITGDAREDRLLDAAGIQRATCILAVTNDDLTNVSIALDARRMNPAIGVVVRLFDQKLAAHFEHSARINRALSTSALAAPAFVAAALGSAVRGAFEIDGTWWVVRDQEYQAPAGAPPPTIRQWALRLNAAPLALKRGAATTLRPAAELPLEPGDRLTLLGPADADQWRGFARDGNSPAPPPRRRFAGLSALADWWHGVPRPLRAAVAALLAVVTVSVLLFRWALRIPLVDALYFVVTTVTTVGYGDYSLKDAPPAMKLYGTFLMLCGAAIMAVLFSIVTDLVLQSRLRDLVARGTARLRGHVIVAGLGNIGFRLVRDLVRAGQRVVAIENREDAEFLQSARELATVIVGNAKTEETLLRAGAAGARAVLAVTDDDLANVSIALAAKEAHPQSRVVLRLFDSTLAEKVQRGLAFDAVQSVSAAAAPTFVGAVLCRDVIHGIVLDDWLVLVSHVCPSSAAPADACTAVWSREEQAVLWIKPAGTKAYEIAAADASPRAGDRAVSVAWRHLHAPTGPATPRVM